MLIAAGWLQGFQWLLTLVILLQPIRFAASCARFSLLNINSASSFECFFDVCECRWWMWGICCFDPLKLTNPMLNGPAVQTAIVFNPTESRPIPTTEAVTAPIDTSPMPITPIGTTPMQTTPMGTIPIATTPSGAIPKASFFWFWATMILWINIRCWIFRSHGLTNITRLA